jgi:hypothetical protein
MYTAGNARACQKYWRPLIKQIKWCTSDISPSWWNLRFFLDPLGSFHDTPPPVLRASFKCWIPKCLHLLAIAFDWLRTILLSVIDGAPLYNSVRIYIFASYDRAAVRSNRWAVAEKLHSPPLPHSVAVKVLQNSIASTPPRRGSPRSRMGTSAVWGNTRGVIPDNTDFLLGHAVLFRQRNWLATSLRDMTSRHVEDAILLILIRGPPQTSREFATGFVDTTYRRFSGGGEVYFRPENWLSLECQKTAESEARSSAEMRYDISISGGLINSGDPPIWAITGGDMPLSLGCRYRKRTCGHKCWLVTE